MDGRNTTLQCYPVFRSEEWLGWSFAGYLQAATPHTWLKCGDALFEIVIMDVKVCAALSLIEAISLRGFGPLHSTALVGVAKPFATLFLVQYLLLKVYRLVLYPRFFSPLRRLPGPKVLLCAALVPG